ncbi:MAG: hypothetical protein ACOCW2_02525 [Chitinivibrionales bacterium]
MVEAVEAVQQAEKNVRGTSTTGETEVDEQMRRQLRENINYYAKYPDQIDTRLLELDREWDIDQMLETHFSTVSLTGLIMGGLGKRGWFLLPIIAGTILLQHAFRGWSPPVEFYRRFGVRSKREIMREHYALRALRGDFDPLGEMRGFSMSQKVDAVLETIW